MAGKVKIGDRVRITLDSPVVSGTEGVISGIIGNSVTVRTNFPCTYDVSIDEVELIAPADPKSEFLKELKALLVKYKAEIWADGGYDWCHLHLELNEGCQKFNVEGNGVYYDQETNLLEYSEF